MIFFLSLQSDKFVMRSQLDCHDPRLPGTGIFDIKTRACISIRMDILNYQVLGIFFTKDHPLLYLPSLAQENAGYLIEHQHGFLGSFEREYYDLIRSAFLKYRYKSHIPYRQTPHSLFFNSKFPSTDWRHGRRNGGLP